MRPSTPDSSSPLSKKRRTSTAVIAGVDPDVDVKHLLGSPSRSAGARASPRRKRTLSSTSSTSPEKRSSKAAARGQSASSSASGSASSPLPRSPDLSILSPATKRAVALASPSSRSPRRMEAPMSSSPGSPGRTLTMTPRSKPSASLVEEPSRSSSTLASRSSQSSVRSSWDLLSALSTPATSVAASSPTSHNSKAKASVAGVNAATNASAATTDATPRIVRTKAVTQAVEAPASLSGTSQSVASSATMAGRALSLRERIQAKEDTRLKELEGMTRRHGALFARVAGGRSASSETSLGLGITDADEAALAGPPALPTSSSSSSSLRARLGARRFGRTSSAPSPSTQGLERSATKRQTAVLMDVLKRKSLVSRLPEIADSLYMLFTQAAAAQGMSMPNASSSSAASPAKAGASRVGRGSEGSSLKAAINATPRVPVLPLSEVLTSLTRSSRTILSRVELREALNLLMEFVPGFLEIRKVGQGGAEWATLGYGRAGNGGGSTEGGTQALGLKEVRERLKALV